MATIRPEELEEEKFIRRGAFRDEVTKIYQKWAWSIAILRLLKLRMEPDRVRAISKPGFVTRCQNPSDLKWK